MLTPIFDRGMLRSMFLSLRHCLCCPAKYNLAEREVRANS